MTPFDPEFTPPRDADEADLFDYDDRDQWDLRDAMTYRELLTGLPSRPGVVR